MPNTPAEDLAPLLTDCGGKWTLSKDGKGLERHLKFKTFKRTKVGVNGVSLDEQAIVYCILTRR